MVKVTNSYGDIAIGNVNNVAVYQRFYGKSVRRAWDGKKKNNLPQQIAVQQRFRNGIDFAASLSTEERKFLAQYVESLKLKMTWQNYAKNISMAPVKIDKSQLIKTVKPPSLNPIVNGDFEKGNLSSWTIDGFVNSPVIATSQKHSGNSSAQLGNYGGSAPVGVSSFYQEITVPYNATLYFWYYPFSQDWIMYSWQDVYITDTAGNILATIFHQCSNSNTWTLQTYDMSAFADKRVRLKFLVRQDDWNSPTAMFIDDISILTPADFIIPSIKGTIAIQHPAIKQIALHDPSGNILNIESGLTDLASGVITVNKSWDLDIPFSTASLEVTTADNRVHRIPL